ncbi:MAG: hypothetical protein JWQ66_2090 [Mucilaginibacter sp.]|nr:hypothetical protein [Mucilaginibacter sp.]
MNYLKFTIWLFGLYFIYYTIIILWDLLRTSRNGVKPEEHVLTFAESVAPVQPKFELTAEDIKSPVFASGGVSLKKLFNLAQEEAIEYTSQVSF